MKENIPRKFKRIVAGSWAINLGVASIVAYQLIWALNTILNTILLFLHLFNFVSDSSCVERKAVLHFRILKSTRERWQPIYFYKWDNIVKPCLRYFRVLNFKQRENKLFPYISTTKTAHTTSVSWTLTVQSKGRGAMMCSNIISSRKHRRPCWHPWPQL